MEIIKDIKIEGPHNKPVLLDIFYKGDGKLKPLLIFSHGFKGFKDWGTFNIVAREFANKGFVFIKFNYSHNGTTPSNPVEFTDMKAFRNNNFSIELDDLGAVIDFVLDTPLIPEHQVNHGEVYLLGHSRGGAISILKAGEDKRIKKLVTWAAVNDLSKRWSKRVLKQWKEEGEYIVENKRTGQLMPMGYQLIEDFERNHSRLDIPSVVKKIEIPFMAVHGTEDDAIEFEQAIEFKKWNKKVKLNLVPSANHTFGGKHPYKSTILPDALQQVVNDTIDFLKH